MELDFSIRSPKRPRSPRNLVEVEPEVPAVPAVPVVPERANRLRAEVDAAFERTCADAPELTTCEAEGRPPTPDHLIEMRMLIEAEDAGVPLAPPAPAAQLRYDLQREDPFKHAGLLREYGGIQGWRALQKQERERRGVCTVSLP